jgi:hypothetical protein
MKTFGFIIIVCVVLVIASGAVDSCRTASLRTKARSVKPGDSKQEVERILGRATAVFTPLRGTDTNLGAAFFSVKSERWAYGRRFDFYHSQYREYPYFCPFRLRLFRPDPADIDVEFDASGRVARVTIPGAAK